jgi:hypothetical protein
MAETRGWTRPRRRLWARSKWLWSFDRMTALTTALFAVLAEQYELQVEPLKNIEKGDVLRFRHATCFVVDRREGMLSAGDTTPYNVICRVVGG